MLEKRNTPGLTEDKDGTVSIDLEAIRAGAERERQKRTEQAAELLSHIGDKGRAERNAMDELFTKAMLSDRADRKRAEDKRIDEENARLMAKHEAEQEAKHLPTEHSNKLDAAYRKLLG